MPELFERTTIQSLELSNRTVRSATWSGVADNKGFVTQRVIDMYNTLAEGGVGLIVTGFQYVLPNAVAMPYQIGNYAEEMLDGLTRWAAAIHTRGGKVVAQLVHTGSKANPDLFPKEGEVWGPSPVTDPWSGRTPKEMTQQDITQVVEAFASAASRCQRAGFDGIQLHGAHGYAINQFLSAACNCRSDEYGGDIRKRYRFLGEIVEAVRGAVGKEYPLLIKLSGDDYYQGGLTQEESLTVGRLLEQNGIDAIEVSGGSRASFDGMIPSRPHILREHQEAYLADVAAAFKQAVDVPIITVGGIRSYDVASSILAEGRADYVAFCRPLIREPDLIARWKRGDRGKATCISCNGCFETGLHGDRVRCAADKNRVNE
jgi:2,4-dienoyl-CoA reductase-like NADH-dependent reductase (Old Yellow Enzyme family)